MTDELNGWSLHRGGETISNQGSEDGVILEDEEYASAARITLERGGRMAPFSITCGVYGLLVHTRFFSTEDEARREYGEMKADLGQMVDLTATPGASEKEIIGMLMTGAARFVERFPT